MATSPQRFKSVRDTSRESVREAADNAAELANEYYDRASTWIQENYGRTIAIVGAVSAIGILGYFIGRRGFEEFLDRSREAWSSRE